MGNIGLDEERGVSTETLLDDETETTDDLTLSGPAVFDISADELAALTHQTEASQHETSVGLSSPLAAITASDIRVSDSNFELNQDSDIVYTTSKAVAGFDYGEYRGHTTHHSYTRTYHRPETLDDRTPQQGDPWYISNVNSNLHHIYINGIRTDHDAFESNVDSVNDITGRGVLALEAVHNTTQGTLADIWNCVRGFLSPLWGASAEPEAVSDLAVEIMGQINADPESEVRIVAHSQGAIVASNTLFMIERELGPERWAEIAPRIHVLALGAGNHRWPDEIPSEHIHSYAHHGDVVPFITRALSFLSFGYGAGSQVVEPVTMPAVDPSVTDPHDLEGYNVDMPHFIIHGYHGDPEGLARELGTTIRSGEFPDSTHEDVIRIMVEVRENAAFARAFLQEIEERGLGEYTTAYLDQLHTLASETA